MRIYLYLKGEKIYYLNDGKTEEILPEKIDGFIKDNKKKLFILIVSKLNTYFRKIEFNFRDRKKINLVLNQEIEGKLPKSLENFYFYFEFYYPGKNKTIVNLFAIEKEKIEYFKRIFKNYKVKFILTVDSVLLHQFMRKKVKEKDFIGIFIENDYLLFNLIENSVISNIYSYFSNNIKENIEEISGLLLSSKKLPVYFIGKREIYENVKTEEMKFLCERSFFDILKDIKLENLKFKTISVPQKIFSFEYIFYFLFLLGISFFFINPYFEKNKKEKKIEEINRKMENVYKDLFPETEKIINPLVQIKEKITQNEKSIKIPVFEKSIIKILEEVTLLFPEDINAEIEELVFAGKNVNLTGTIDNLKNIDRVKENVKKSKIFKDLYINNISFTKENRIIFNLLFTMKEQ